MRIEGLEHLKSLEGTPVILMMPHFTGLELAGLRMSLETPLVSIYSRQKDVWLDEFFRTRRLRLGTGIIFSRQEGTRSVIRALRDAYRLYYLPDQDFGHRDSVFVPSLASMPRRSTACLAWQPWLARSFCRAAVLPAARSRWLHADH